MYGESYTPTYSYVVEDGADGGVPATDAGIPRADAGEPTTP
jgi:hypothetical protein